MISRSPHARPGNRNAAKPDELRRVVLPAQRVDPQTLRTLTAFAAHCGGIGRALDAAAVALTVQQARNARRLFRRMERSGRMVA